MLNYLRIFALAVVFNSCIMPIAVAAKNQLLGGWNVPVRYAFITDKNLPELSVFDTYSKEVIYHLALKTKADIIDISPQGGFMVYAQMSSKSMFKIDLSTGEQEEIFAKSKIKQLYVHAYGRWLAYESDNKVVIKDLSTGIETDFATSGDVSMLFSPTGGGLFISELTHGKLIRINLPDLEKQVLFELGRPISPVSIMPNMMALHFSADNKIYRYSLLDEAIEDYPEYASSQRPYVTSESRSLFTLDNVNKNKPKLLLVNNYTKKLKASYPLDGMIVGNDNIFTGWLEKRVVVITDKNIQSFDLETGLKKITPISDETIDKLVAANSKELLATVTNSSKLLVFNMKSQSIDSLIETGLPNPNHVLMGQTATLCH